MTFCRLVLHVIQHDSGRSRAVPLSALVAILPRAFQGFAFHPMRSILPTGSRDLSGKTSCLGMLFSNFSISLSVNIVRVELEFRNPRHLVVKAEAKSWLFGTFFPLLLFGVCTDSELKAAKGFSLPSLKWKRVIAGLFSELKLTIGFDVKDYSLLFFFAEPTPHPPLICV